MSLPNTRRLFLRRFHDVCSGLGMPEDSALRSHHAALGTTFLCQTYQAQVERCSHWASQS